MESQNRQSFFFNLASFIQHNYFVIHPRYCLHQYLILFYCSIVFTIWIYHNLFIHLFNDGNMSCYQFGAVVNKVTVYMSLYGHFSHFSWLNTWNGMNEIYGRYLFDFLGNCPIVFQSSYTIFHSHVIFL